MEWGKVWPELWQHHRGKVSGVLVGLIFGILTAFFGFWKAIFVFLAIGIGYFVGWNVDQHGGFQGWLESIFRRR